MYVFEHVPVPYSIELRIEVTYLMPAENNHSPPDGQAALQGICIQRDLIASIRPCAQPLVK